MSGASALLDMGEELLWLHMLVFLRAKNITDEEIRNATSFMRNFAPEPGRTLELGVRFDL